ncbi:MAG: hypothetical protein ACK448_02080 [Bacteroidota bacterium]
MTEFHNFSSKFEPQSNATIQSNNLGAKTKTKDTNPNNTDSNPATAIIIPTTFESILNNANTE